MERLGAVITARVQGWGGVDLPNERALFGTTDPDMIAAEVDEWCRLHLGSAIARYEFFESSSGSVHGVELADGRRVVVKGHRSSVSVSFLNAIGAVQKALCLQGYPAPAPLVAPVAFGPGHMTAETMLQRSVSADAHDSSVRSTLAHGLWRFIDVSRSHRDVVGRVVHPMRAVDGALYPVPHSPRFNLEATCDGAEWIDAFRVRSMDQLQVVPAGDDTVVHGDWRIENLAVRDGRLVGVFDWDSLHVASETTAVAIAAATFTVDWNAPTARRFPFPGEMNAFIGEYETARGAYFSNDESRALAASIVASLAYGARCEHADSPTGEFHDDSQRGLLSALGERLLSDGLAALRAERVGTDP